MNGFPCSVKGTRDPCKICPVKNDCPFDDLPICVICGERVPPNSQAYLYEDGLAHPECVHDKDGVPT